MIPATLRENIPIARSRTNRIRGMVPRIFRAKQSAAMARPTVYNANIAASFAFNPYSLHCVCKFVECLLPKTP
jgi:hypothetical protein